MDRMNIIDIYRGFHPRTSDYTFSSTAHGTFSRTDHLLGHKTSLNTIKKRNDTKHILWPQCFEIRNQLLKESLKIHEYVKIKHTTEK